MMAAWWGRPLVSDERRAESGQRLVQVGEAVLNVEMWKENPAKAAGMLTGDLCRASDLVAGPLCRS